MPAISYVQKSTNMQNMTKGEIMKKIFTDEELRSIDSAIPHGSVPPNDSFFYVMNYNKNKIFGELLDMREEALRRGITLDSSS